MQGLSYFWEERKLRNKINRLTREHRNLVKHSADPEAEVTPAFIQRTEARRQFMKLRGAHLLWKADQFDVPIPQDDEYWWETEKSATLSDVGAAKLQALIRAEKKARREQWLPLVTALTGLGGIVVAILTLLRSKP